MKGLLIQNNSVEDRLPGYRCAESKEHASMIPRSIEAGRAAHSESRFRRAFGLFAPWPPVHALPATSTKRPNNRITNPWLGDMKVDIGKVNGHGDEGENDRDNKRNIFGC